MKHVLPKILLVTVAVVLLPIAAGQFGLLAGTAPATLGVHDGRLAPPSRTPNSVSSQAALYPDHPQRQSAQIEPLTFSEEGEAAMRRLAAVIGQMPRTHIVTARSDYIHAEFHTPQLRFTDDLELWLDRANGIIQVRSASRLGKGDLGVNRARVETLRALYSG